MLRDKRQAAAMRLAQRQGRCVVAGGTTRLERFFREANKARRVMPALMKMVKLDIRQLEEAAK